MAPANATAASTAAWRHGAGRPYPAAHAPVGCVHRARPARARHPESPFFQACPGGRASASPRAAYAKLDLGPGVQWRWWRNQQIDITAAPAVVGARAKQHHATTSGQQRLRGGGDGGQVGGGQSHAGEVTAPLPAAEQPSFSRRAGGAASLRRATFVLPCS